jgi:rhodanese-related sulfurtransferase
MPHAKINQDNLSQYPEDTIFIVYCAGPHCNATEKAAIKLARLGHPVKKMVGGVVGWLDEGFDLIIDT